MDKDYKAAALFCAVMRQNGYLMILGMSCLLRTTFVINTVQFVQYGFFGLVTNADLF